MEHMSGNFGECCLFKVGNTGNGQPNRRCNVKMNNQQSNNGWGTQQSNNGFGVQQVNNGWSNQQPNNGWKIWTVPVVGHQTNGS